jgi:hypothetical protein
MIENKGEYLYVERTEPYELNSFIGLMKEVAGACRQQNVRKVLVNIRAMPGKIKFAERFQVGAEGAEIFRGVAKVGIVDRKEEINWFAETVSVNRGADVRIFADIEDAMEWLGIK